MIQNIQYLHGENYFVTSTKHFGNIASAIHNCCGDKVMVTARTAFAVVTIHIFVVTVEIVETPIPVC